MKLSTLVICLIAVCIEAAEEADVTFYLYTDPGNYYQVEKTDVNQYIEGGTEILFLIHGWTESRHQDWYEQLKNALFSKSNATRIVIQVDWSGPASESYRRSKTSAKQVGGFVGKFIANLRQDPTNVHIIGHSLGGQAAGIAGQTILQLTGMKLGRITALDPAGPNFGFFTDDEKRLSRNDAAIVVVIHTDGGKFGFLPRCGTVDIYPNGGSAPQPGCFNITGFRLFCSHQRSHAFFIDALTSPNTLIATKCNSYASYMRKSCKDNQRVDLGGDFIIEDEGKFYLKTREEKPFGLGDNE